MAFIIINGQKINYENINIAVVNEIGNIFGTDHYFLTIFEQDDTSSDFFSFNTAEEAQKKLAKLHRFMTDKGVKNFANINNEFLINMDNIESLDGYVNQVLGKYAVEAKFKNNQEFVLYDGFDEKNAHKIVDSYKEQEDEYFNSAEFC